MWENFVFLVIFDIVTSCIIDPFLCCPLLYFIIYLVSVLKTSAIITESTIWKDDLRLFQYDDFKLKLSLLLQMWSLNRIFNDLENKAGVAGNHKEMRTALWQSSHKVLLFLRIPVLYIPLYLTPNIIYIPPFFLKELDPSYIPI